MSSEQVRNTEGASVLIEAIEENYGLVAAQEFGAMYASRINQVMDKINEMETAIDSDMHEFEKLASWAITESARMNSYRGNFEDLHVVATVAHSISNQWMEEQGKNIRCSMHSPYARAWRLAARNEGHYGMAERPTECYCTGEPVEAYS